ncbi:MAG: preprotein translocase subunit SecE [Candidatus Gracilibacteria bacterium]|nr:preprotein translocase subunit SecE [Candidatus Gracilibacteria bacterium]
MIQFFKDSVRELKHVVWPTKQETTKYFLIVVSVLVLFGIYLFIASTLFSEGLLYLKNMVSN